MIEAAKFVHVAAIAIWIAGLVCLPGLYVQRARVSNDDTLFRLQAMVRYAYIVIISPAAFVAIASGTALIFLRQTFEAWFSVKLGLVGLLVLIHVLTGLVVIRLFREGETYPVWRFVAVTVLTSVVALAILAVVLAKPLIPDLLPAGLFAPGALSDMLAPLNPWATP